MCLNRFVSLSDQAWTIYLFNIDANIINNEIYFCSLLKIIIDKKMGWCDDPKSIYYNKIIKYPFKYRSEKLWRKDNIYDIIIIIDYNLNPVIKNKGSAIFLHIAKRNYQPTDGCIAVSKKNIKFLLSKINKKTKIKIY